MALLAFIADLHVANHRAHGGQVIGGLNYRARLTIDTLKRAYTKARELGCTGMFILGDVFDTTRPEPQLIAAVQDVLSDGVQTFVLEGNHDMVSMAEGDHALGPLRRVSRVITKTTRLEHEHVPITAVPFQPGRAVEWLEDEVKKNSDLSAILLLHLGISSDDTPAFMRDAHDQIPLATLKSLVAKHRFRAVFAGNWHGHRIFDAGGVPAVQVGTLSPTGWDNPGMSGVGTMPVFDTVTGGLTVEVIPGPRFLNLTGDELLSGWQMQPAGNQIFVRVRCAADQLAASRAVLETQQAAGNIVAFELLLEDAEVRAAARTAATVAKGATTFEEALAGFVGQMPMPENVDRQAVLSKTKALLGV